MLVSHCLNYCSFEVSFEIKKYEIPDFVVLFQDCFGYLGTGPLQFHIHFRISFRVFTKNRVLISLGVSANVLIDLIRAFPHAFIILLLLTGRVLVALLERRELG